MKRLILLTTLAAAVAPATAFAWPGTPREPYPPDPTSTDETEGIYPDRGYEPWRHDDTYDTRHDRGFHERWITLSAFTPARKGRETVYLTGRDRKIDRVRIHAVRGAPVVRN